MEKTLAILERLISFKSVTPDEAGSITYIKTLLAELGFDNQIFEYESKAGKVTNLYSKYKINKKDPKKKNKKLNICFAGHVDVVPPMLLEKWSSDPFEMHIHDERVVGRGTVDMKGAIACYIAAIKEFLQQNDSNINLSFLITSDEEGEGRFGTKKILEDLKPDIDFCIVGEPTNIHEIGDTVKIGRRGSINFDLVVTGKQGHVAYPGEAINPLDAIGRIVRDLCKLKLDKGTEYFMSSNIEVTSIDTNNPTTNIIPESVNCKFNIRFNSLHNQDSLVGMILELVSKHSDNYDLEYSCNSECFIQEYSKLMQNFVSSITQITGIKPEVSTSGGTSDARFIHKYCSVIEFGLNSSLAHKINEYTKISDLQTLKAVYYNFLCKINK